MKYGAEPRHLIVLAADKHIASVLETLLSRRPSDMGIHAMSFDVRRHPESDPGCRTRSAEFLRPLINGYRHALVVFDHRGCGEEKRTPAEIRGEVEDELGRNGWRERSRAIVIKPELESWIWSRSGRVAHVLGWGRSFEPLREWLQAEGFWPAPQPKPSDPKRAVEQALRHKGKVLSSALFRELAASVRLDGCQDPAFNDLRKTLQAWFPREATP